MVRDLSCLRCGGKMAYARTESIQLGRTGWVLGDLTNLLAGGLEVAIYVCPGCGKVEFFRSEEADEGSDTPQVKCPACGREHDFDHPRCPYCKHSYV